MTNPSLSDLRLRRLLLWVSLWLRGAAWFLGAHAHETPAWLEATLRGPLVYARRVLFALILLRALRRAPGCARRRAQGRRWFHPHRVARGSRKRKYLGARLNRLGRGDLASAIAELAALAANFEAEVARMTRRVARGLTRLTPILPTRAPILAQSPRTIVYAALCADTS